MVDVESDGPIPGDYSMLSFGVVNCDSKAGMYSNIIKPISDKFIPEALAISGINREVAMIKGGDPKGKMLELEDWLKQFNCQPMFISDNNGYDWMFMCWYFHHFLGRNPFGHSSTNLGSLYKGIVLNVRKNFKHLRKTSHTHNPVDDAMGNVEAFQYMKAKMGLYGA